MKSRAARLAPLLVTGFLLVLLLRQLRALGGGLAAGAPALQPEPGWLLAGVACFVGVNLLRAWRFRVLLPGQPVAAGALLPVGFALSFLNNILPLRGGELSFPLLMRESYGVPVADGTASIGLARIIDYLAVAAWFLPLALLSLDRIPATIDWPAPAVSTSRVLGIVILFMLALGLGVTLLAALGRQAIALLRRLLDRLGLGERAPAQRLVWFAIRTVQAFETLRSRGIFGRAFLLSLAVWMGVFAWQYCFARGLAGPPVAGEPGFASLGFGLFVVGATFGTLSKMIPVPTLGGHGVTEAGWALGFTLVGIPPRTAIASSLGITVLTLVVSTLFGLPALARLRARRRDLAAPAGETG